MASKTVKIVGVILVVLLIFFFFVVYGVYRLTRTSRVEVQKGTVLEVTLEGAMPELPSTAVLARLMEQDQVSLFQMRNLLRAAAKDERITAMHLTVLPLEANWAQVEEIRALLKEFRNAKKKIYANLGVDMANEIEVYLASAADEIYLNPDAGLLINGLVAEVSFFKRLMDKLSIQPQTLQFKEFKSPEVFTRERMTPEIRSMLESILKDIQDRFVEQVAADRGIEQGRLRELMNTGMAPAPLAVQEKLVTALGYEDEIRAKLMTDKSDGGKEYRSISASRYWKSVQDQQEKGSKHQIALLGGMGPITAGESDETWGEFMGGETIAEHLRNLRKEKDIKGVLFRVNSPGGSAVGSDKVWREVRLLEQEGKPVVVSMGGVAGSGGYYIAMGARKIVAQPSTITGSIGVIFQKFNIRGFYESWLGITTDQVKLAENADIFSPVQSLTEEQKKQISSWMQDIYENFVRKAAEGRNMSFEELEQKAHGRIYTGTQAKALNLVDAVGGIDTALSLLKQELKIPEEEQVKMVLYPRPKSPWEALLEGDLFKLMTQPTSVESVVQEQLRALQTTSPWLLAPDITIH